MPFPTFSAANEFGSLAEADLTRFEGKYQVSLPEDYRTFLLKQNGGTPSPNTIDFVEERRMTSSDLRYLCGIHQGPEWARLDFNIEIFQGRIPEGLIAIGYDSGGNQYLLGIRKPYEGQIYFWDHEREAGDGNEPTFANMSFVANSFTQFLEALYAYTESDE